MPPAERPQCRLLTPAEVAAGSGVSAQTVRNWIVYGVPQPDGTRVRLTAARHGVQWRVDPEMLEIFFDACTAAALPPASDPELIAFPIPGRSEQREFEAGQRRLKALGL